MQETAKKTRLAVCLLSAHPVVLEKFRGLLSGPEFALRAQKVDSAFPVDTDQTIVPRAAIYVVDAHVPESATESLLANIQKESPLARVVVIAEEFTETNSFHLLRFGVKGILTYSQADGQLPQAVRAVAGGGYWVPRSVLSRFVDSVVKDVRGSHPSVGAHHLSRREQQVLDALLENLSNKEIANKLYISERTVKFHVSNLLAKFSVRRRADLILLCYQRRPPIN